MLRSLVAVPLVVAALITTASAPVRPSRTGDQPALATYVAPLPGDLHVVRGFTPPVTPYGPGHLGVDIRAARDEVVRAAGSGVVRFSGMVAGRGVVVVQHSDGISTEYEPLHPVVAAGVSVARGQPIGVVVGRHDGCPGTCLHWGARRGDNYLNPLDLLRPLGPVVLLPWSSRS